VSTIGATFRIQVVAYSETGSVASPTLGAVLASLPLQPPAPALVESSSSRTSLDISAFPTASNGGCPVVSFDVQRDDG
jgi:hypothetical protein